MCQNHREGDLQELCSWGGGGRGSDWTPLLPGLQESDSADRKETEHTALPTETHTLVGPLSVSEECKEAELV